MDGGQDLETRLDFVHCNIGVAVTPGCESILEVLGESGLLQVGRVLLKEGLQIFKS